MSKNNEITPEKNVITPEEFEKIEKKEGKKPEKIETKKEEPKRVETKATDVEKLVLKTEKLEGKFESVTAERQALSDRLSILNEEIGEIRSSVLGRDKTFNEIQTEFKEMQDNIKDISPRSIAANLERGVQGIEVNAVKIEGLEAKSKQIAKELKTIKTTLFKIRDVQNLVEIIEGLKKKINSVEKDRKYTSRLAGKVEAMFAELSDKIGELDRFKDKITLNEDAMHELMKTVDMIDIKIDQMVKKDDLKKSEDKFAKKIEATRMEWDDKVYDMKKLVDELIESLKNAGVKGMLDKVGKMKLEKVFVSKDELKDVKVKLNNLKGLSDEIRGLKEKQFMQAEAPTKEEIVSSVKNELGGGQKPIPRAPQKGAQTRISPQVMSPEVREGVESVEGIVEDMNIIIEKASEAVKAGQTDIAKSKYLEALSLYNQLSQTTTPEEAEALYENIRKLYNRLRIYS